MKARTAALALLICAAQSAPASASTLTTRVDGNEYNQSTLFVEYTADPGEANRVTATHDLAARTFTLTDTGVTTILPPATSPTDLLGLSSVCKYQGNRVTCRAEEEAIEIEIELGDRDDTASGRSSNTTWWGFRILGGDGNDTLTHAGAGTSRLLGGAGDDTLTKTGRGYLDVDGGAGADVLRAGDGGSYLLGGPGPDRMIGGPMHDTVDYHGLYVPSDPSPDGTTGVRVSFDGAANDGMPGEGDDITDAVEVVKGSRFADVLTGDERAQQLEGYAGDDLIDGAGGDDVLEGEGGHDHLIGGMGVDWLYGGNDFSMQESRDDDVLDTVDGGFDRYACGAGADAVNADAQDVWAYPSDSYLKPTPAECETVTVQP